MPMSMVWEALDVGCGYKAVKLAAHCDVPSCDLASGPGHEQERREEDGIEIRECLHAIGKCKCRGCDGAIEVRTEAG